MPWQARNNFLSSDFLQADDLNYLANDDRIWGGDVNGGGHHLYNVILDSSAVPPGSSDVSSVFGRSGNVIALPGDYRASDVTNAVDATQLYYDPAWIGSLAWSKLVGVPTLVTSAFGRMGNVIAQVGDYTAAQVTNAVDKSLVYADPPWISSLAWSKIVNPPPFVTSVFGRSGAVVAQAGDYTAAQITNAVDKTAIYSDPPWINSLAWSKIVGAPPGQSQTPWTSNQDAAYYTLNNLARLNMADVAAATNSLQVSCVDASDAIKVAASRNLWLQGGWQTDVQSPSIVTISTGSTLTERLRVTATGMVGIGKTAPAYPLDITGDLNITGTYRVNGSPLNTGGFWQGGAGGAIYYNSGNVGIGQSAPPAQLSILGAATYPPSLTYQSAASAIINASGSECAIGFQSTHEAWFQVRNSASAAQPLLLNPLGGNVGIGTASPQVSLESSGSIRSTGGSNPASGVGLELGYNTSAGRASILAYDRSGGAYKQVGLNDNLYVGGAGGNVGIGTTSPAQALDVVSGNIAVQGSAGYSIYMWSSTDGNWRMGMSPNTANVGFARSLCTSYVMYATFANGANQGFAVGDHLSGYSSFEVAGSGSNYQAYFRGAVGIGMLPTSYALMVSGDISCTSWFRVQGGTGIYWDSYGGGLYMFDANNLKTYGSVSNFTIGSAPIQGALNVHITTNTNIDFVGPAWYGGYAAISALNDAASANIGLEIRATSVVCGNCTGFAINTSWNGNPLVVAGNGPILRLANLAATTYGILHYADGTNYYILLTNANDVWGNYNGLRPFYIGLGNGQVTMSHNVAVGNTLIVGPAYAQSAGDLGVARNSTSGAIYFGNNANQYIYFGSGTFTFSPASSNLPSDARLKQNIRDLTGGIEIINRLRPIEAEWGPLAKVNVGKRLVSLIAQEVQQVLPGAVTPYTGPNPGDQEYLAYNPQEIVMQLILAVQQLSARVEELEKRKN
jgi:hypothetical protein